LFRLNAWVEQIAYAYLYTYSSIDCACADPHYIPPEQVSQERHHNAALLARPANSCASRDYLSIALTVKPPLLDGCCTCYKE
jgi:hypothetical protein